MSNLQAGEKAASSSQETNDVTKTSQSKKNIIPMPSNQELRHSIASNLTEILTNMANGNYKQRCCELLQVNDLGQEAYAKILGALEHTDAEREAKQQARKKPASQ